MATTAEILAIMDACACPVCAIYRNNKRAVMTWRNAELVEILWPLHLEFQNLKMEEKPLKKANTYVFISTDFIAMHSWTGAPSTEYYLRTLHRHKFMVKMWFPVSHSDRDIEFHAMKKAVDNFINAVYSGKALVNISCEMMAERLAKEFGACSVEVSEDGENGAMYHNR